MTDWIHVAELTAIPPAGARVVEHAGQRIALFRTLDDQVFALRDRCPHKGGPLSQGMVCGGRVTCPLHGWTLDLATGEAAAPDVGCAPTLAVKIDAGKVFLRLP